LQLLVLVFYSSDFVVFEIFLHINILNLLHPFLGIVRRNSESSLSDTENVHSTGHSGRLSQRTRGALGSSGLFVGHMTPELYALAQVRRREQWHIGI